MDRIEIQYIIEKQKPEKMVPSKTRLHPHITLVCQKGLYSELRISRRL